MNFLAAAPDLENISLLNASIVAVLGYGMVFAGLIVLMIVVTMLGKAFSAKNKKQNEAPAAPVAAPVVSAPAPVAPVVSDAAPGSAGQLKLYDTPPKTAAMIMAIVADKMGKPLNELRFISIKEVK
ncbi:MAG: OadG family protein [Oscillospiraceae bacterium]|nr:OadG family protein [Oscillospiraceae bacterium]